MELPQRGHQQGEALQAELLLPVRRGVRLRSEILQDDDVMLPVTQRVQAPGVRT